MRDETHSTTWGAPSRFLLLFHSIASIALIAFTGCATSARQRAPEREQTTLRVPLEWKRDSRDLGFFSNDLLLLQVVVDAILLETPESTSEAKVLDWWNRTGSGIATPHALSVQWSEATATYDDGIPRPRLRTGEAAMLDALTDSWRSEFGGGGQVLLEIEVLSYLVHK